MQLGRRFVGALCGGFFGLAPGALACLLYSSVYLGLRGDLAALAYESYIPPTLCLIGAAIGSFAGAVVSWVHWPLVCPGVRCPGKLQGVLVWRLSATGAASGIVLVLFAAGVLWAKGDGRSEPDYLVKVGCAGAFVGWVVALCVGLMLPRLLQPGESAEPGAAADRPRD